jgi:hypothetical protein
LDKKTVEAQKKDTLKVLKDGRAKASDMLKHQLDQAMQIINSGDIPEQFGTDDPDEAKQFINKQFKTMMMQLDQAYQEQVESIEEQAEELIEAIENDEEPPTKGIKKPVVKRGVAPPASSGGLFSCCMGKPKQGPNPLLKGKPAESDSGSDSDSDSD